MYVDRARLVVTLNKLHRPHSALLPINPPSLMSDSSVLEFGKDSPQVENRGFLTLRLLMSYIYIYIYMELLVKPEC